MNVRRHGRHLTDAEEKQIRRQVNEGVAPAIICETWKISMQRLRRAKCGPLQKASYAVENFYKP